MGKEKRSPSEEVRAKLDELGIEYVTPEDDTTIFYDVDGNRYTYNVNPESGWAQLYGYNLTPEQAIAATVGNSTDLSKRLREVHGLHAFAELFGFDWTGESDWDWHDVACAMADAVDAATVGRPKVKKARGMTYDEHGGEVYYLACSGCGEWIDGDLDCITEFDGPNYCPNCGGEFDGPLLCKRCGGLADLEYGDMCVECYEEEAE